MTDEKNRTESTVHAKPPLWLEGWLRPNLASLSAASLTMGGLLIIGFFLHLRFMPDVDLPTSTALLFAVALVGFATIVATAAITLLPGLGTWFLLREAGIKVDRGVLVTAVVPSLMFVAWTLGFAAADPASLADAMPWIFAGSLAIGGGLSIWRGFNVGTESSPTSTARAYKIAMLLVCSLLWLIGMSPALKIGLTLANATDRSPGLVVLICFGWLMLVIGVNAATVQMQKPRQALIFAPVGGLASIALLVVLSQSYAAASSTAVSLLGYGEIPNVDLIVKTDVCRSIALSSATSVRCEGSTDKAAGVLRGVTIRSRIGSQVVVEHQADPRNLGRWSRLVLRKDDVVMWVDRGSSLSN